MMQHKGLWMALAAVVIAIILGGPVLGLASPLAWVALPFGLALAALILAVVVTAAVALFVRWRVPPLGQFVTLGRHRLHYTDEGEGQPLLLIHGLGGHLENFAYLKDHLGPGFRVITVDRPGNGFSRSLSGDHPTMAEQADAMAALIDHLKLPAPLVVGWSLGGLIALALAARHPDKVAGLALLAPLTEAVAEPPAVFAGLMVHAPLLRRILGWTVATPLSIATGAQTAATVFSPEPVVADFAQRDRALANLHPSAFIAACADLTQAFAEINALVTAQARVRQPLAILYGAADVILDPDLHGRRTAERLGGRYEELPEVGHMLPITRPADCADFIRRQAEQLRKTDRVAC